jgi:Na+/H+ antiporter NhaD/arsenite permease-like protein
LFACLLWFSVKLKGKFKEKKIALEEIAPGGTLVLVLGILSLVSVPIFRLLTNLPVFMGMIFGLGIMWIVTDLMHYKYKERKHLLVTSILPKVDVSIILFYLGILLSINALESAGLLRTTSLWLNQHIAPQVIPVLIGLVSSVVDNVSLVAATIGMYPLQVVPKDSSFWLEVAYCAGTGGSILIIGSAAGVALMAIEKVDFMWYTKKITVPALLTYFVGLGAYLLLSPLTQMLG